MMPMRRHSAVVVTQFKLARPFSVTNGEIEAQRRSYLQLAMVYFQSEIKIAGKTQVKYACGFCMCRNYLENASGIALRLCNADAMTASI